MNQETIFKIFECDNSHEDINFNVYTLKSEYKRYEMYFTIFITEYLKKYKLIQQNELFISNLFLVPLQSKLTENIKIKIRGRLKTKSYDFPISFDIYARDLHVIIEKINKILR